MDQLTIRIYPWAVSEMGETKHTYNNKSSFGPLNAVTLGPVDNFVVFHGDLYVDLLSDSPSVVVSLITGVVADAVVLDIQFQCETQKSPVYLI